MPLPKYDAIDAQTGVLDKVIDALASVLEDTAPVDIVAFAENAAFLDQRLYPRQRLFLKLYYHIDLGRYPCFCLEKSPDPNPSCNLCSGTGVYDELEDTKRMLSAENKYARLYFPGLCRHHITGECDNPFCFDEALSDDYRILSDEELRSRLKHHYAHILEIIGGRRGSKSLLGAVVNAYSLYLLLRDPDPHETFGIVRVPIGTANVATDEEQAKILLNQMKALMEKSAWFSRVAYRALEVTLEFTGRKIYSRSYHSNSASVRGQTLIAVFLDEFAHFNKTNGKLSDRAMKNALFPSVLTFGRLKRIVITTSPVGKAGVCWDTFESAVSRVSRAVIAVQISTWEMNPTVSRDDSEIENAYRTDPDYREMEYGAQWAESVGVYIPPESVDACVVAGRGRALTGSRGIKYCLAIDLSKNRDRSAFCITHFDKLSGKVVVDRIEEFDPKLAGAEWRNTAGEIDHEAVFAYICRLSDQYNFRFQSITCDQFQSAWLLQALRKKFGDIKGDWIDELTVTQKLNNEMFGNLRSLIVQGGIEYYKYEPLLRELKLLSRSVKPSGAFKVEAPPGEHDDLADVLAESSLMCLALALGLSSGIVVIKKQEQSPNTPSSDIEGLFHKRGCTDIACVWECPVYQEKIHIQFGVSHLKSCSKSYCDMMCPVLRRMQEG